MAKQYRINGSIGAILDEYEKALLELQHVIADVSREDLKRIVDYNTKDADCKSIQTILTHVLKAGYNYIVEIRKSLGETLAYIKVETLETSEQYTAELKRMFEYNEQFFRDYPNLLLEEYDLNKKVLVRWGQRYDVDQLLEHAIVHILRHRRQIEIFIGKLR